MTPSLIHPVPCVVRRLNVAATTLDQDFREPVGQAARHVDHTLPGQVKWGMDKNYSSMRIGPVETSDGYVLFRMADIRAVGGGFSIKRDDQLVSIGGIETNVFVVALRYEGHYTHLGGPAFVKAFFKDREPVGG